MLKNISKLGSKLPKNKQRNILGGKSATIGSGLSKLCSEGQFACLCNFHFIGCYSSTGLCENSCKHHF
ncbi:hypothetical protein [Tenacibaculum sp. SDUM215027]|uniref:hypothetical protein n=1 Tax=Tenacibaculum sp. SDUM215027 TaxID=3422596 RepID=UPI003D31DC11